MSMIKERNRYVAAVIGTALFAVIYEMFSHQVYSGYMILAFLFPLLGGVIPFSVFAFVRKRTPGIQSRCLYGSGIATLTAGSIFKGILEIYGTTSRFCIVYWYAGGCLISAGILLWILERRKADEVL